MHRAAESADALGRLRDALAERTQGLLNTQGDPGKDGMSHSQCASLLSSCLCARVTRLCHVMWPSRQAHTRGSAS